MPKSEHQKIKLVKLLEILRMYSDEEHPLGTYELIERLNKEGVSVARKALASDIKLLKQFGYEIMERRGATKLYYVDDRELEVPELKILIDAVQTASCITAKKTAELIGKIAALGGTHKAELLKKGAVQYDTCKSTNESIYYSVDSLNGCIGAGKKASFIYFDYDLAGGRIYRRDKERYIVNPLALVFSENNYYLVCYDDKHKDPGHYRVDRMEGVQAEEENITPLECAKDFNAGRHRRQAFNMFTGKTVNVSFSADRALLDAVYDKFGKVRKMPAENGRFFFNADVQISPAFFGWCAGLKDKLIILSPDTVIEEYKKSLEESLKQYCVQKT